MSPDKYPASYKTITALTPSPDKSIGQTLAPYPTFFWYMPAFKPGYANTLEFSLKDEQQKKIVYQTLLPVSGQAGIMSLTLPEKSFNQRPVPSLEVGKVYRWTVNVVCDLDDRSAEDTIEGAIVRVEPSRGLLTKVQKAAPQNLPEVYAGAGIWYEALGTLADLRRTNPDNPQFASTWADLMEAVDLKKLASEPLADCCRLNPARVTSAQ